MEVKEGNNVNLIGGNVINTGTIKAPQGTIIVNSVEGTKIVKLSQEGSLLSLELDLTNSNLNLSELTPLDLPALLTGSEVNTGLEINNDGKVIITDWNTIIPTEQGASLISGIIDTSGNNGGNILILGNKVGLFDANINANGNNNGGTILIGGDYQGQGLIPNSQITFVDPNTTINADSLNEGNGGKVIIWADQTTRFFGEINARGGNISGDGGFVEVSGKNNLNFQGKVNTFAPNGNIGTLLLDPDNLTIVDGNSPYSGTTNIFDGILLATDDPGDQTMGVNYLLDYVLHYTDVTLEASNNITWDAPLIYTAGATVGLKNDRILTLKAGNLITINNSISSSFDTGLNQSLKLTLNATGNEIVINSNIDTFGGSINMTATGGNITVGNNVTLKTGEEFGSVGNISLIASNGLINIGSGVIFDTTVPSGTTGGVTTITNPENVTNNGTLTLGSGNITLEAKPPETLPETPVYTEIIETTEIIDDYYQYNFNNYEFDYNYQIADSTDHTKEKFDYCENSLLSLFSGDNLAHIRQFEKRINEDIYGYYLGNSNITCKGNVSPQARLRQIEELTGEKGALIYARFVPENEEIIEDDNLIWLLNKSNLKSELSPNPEKKAVDQLEITVITGNGDIIKKKIPEATRENVKTLVNKFIASVTDTRRKKAYETPSKQLYNVLITPIESELNSQDIDNLTFVMDEELRSLSVAALYDEKTEQFLVEKYSLAMMPSFSLTNSEYSDIKNTPILTMGSEKFENKNQEQSPLPAVPTELSLITNQMWQGEGELFLNENFTISNLQEVRASETPFGILHLATHGEFHTGSVDNSYIQFWDNKLSLDQLETLRLNAPPVDLLVLSACKTAVGDKDAELGFAGLAIAAGVKTSLGSLWYVSDQGTLALMTSFYNALRYAPIKAEALRSAQIDMIKGNVHYENGELIVNSEAIPLPENLARQGTPDLSHPYYWSAFTLVGSPW